MKSVADIIVRPLITEKSMDGIGNKVYTFEVQKNATKAEVALAVETMFKKTKVVKVNIINMKKKPKRYGIHFMLMMLTFTTLVFLNMVSTASATSALVAFF